MNIQQQIAMNEYTQKCIRKIARRIMVEQFIKNYGDITVMLTFVIAFAVMVK